MKLETNEPAAGTDEGTVGTDTDRSDLADLSAERGITVDVLAAAGIRIDDGGGRHQGWFVIPYPHRSGAWKCRYRNPDPEGTPRYLDDVGAKFHLYNPLKLGPGEAEVWFTEGEFDCLSLIDQGYKAIGIHGVSNVPDEDDDARGFKREWALLFEDTLCVVMFDNDDAGLKAGRKLARGLNGETFDEWNPAYCDINDWHRADPVGLGLVLAGYVDRVRRSRGMVS